MRLRSLQLVKYGHFEDKEIAFGPGLTVVHGPNEAGKSTLLDGLGAFLWGVHNKNRRAFKYAPGSALLTGRLESGDVAVTLVRRLRKLSCDGVEQEPIWGPASLDSDQAWRQTFGMDRAGLRQGGREVVSGRGDLADLIAMAETGEAISRVLSELEARAEAIYKDRKNTACEIRTTTDTIAELTQQISEGEASAADVAALQTRIEELAGHEASLRAALEDARREQRRMEELQRCFDPAARLREARRALELAIADGAAVDGASAQRLQEAVQEAVDAAAGAAEIERQIGKALQRRTGHAFSPDILAAASEIAALREELPARRADRATLADTGAVDRLVRALGEVLRRLGSTGQGDPLDSATELLLGEQVRDQLTRYAEDLSDAVRSHHEQQARVAQLERDITDADSDAIEDEGERDVILARRRRDQAWEQVKGPWLSGQLPDPAQRQSMAQTVSDEIAGADEVAQSRSDALEVLGQRRGEAAQRARQLQQAQRDLAEAAGALGRAERHWEALAARHSLPAGLDPDGWRVHAGLLDELATAADEVRSNREDRSQAQQRLAAFEQAVGPLANLVDAGDNDPFTVVERLGKALDDARAAEKAVAEIDQQIADLQEQRADLEQRRAAAERDTREVMGDIDEPVATVLARSLRRAAAQQAVTDAQEVLRQTKDPETDLDALAEAAAATDLIALDGQAQAATQRVEHETSAHTEVSRQLWTAERDLEQLTTRKSVAHLVAERVEHASHLQSLVEEYRGLRVQIALLQRYKQWLADNSDSTVLEHAGELLAALTAGRFDGFVVVEQDGVRRIDVRHNDPGSRGEPTTMALADLSEGTADQVFLALRLAGIAVRQRQRADSGLAMVPVVLDDVLMSHDDDRAATALQAMAGLGDQMQIVLLTHHRSVADAAAAIDGVHVSELDAAPTPAVAAAR